MAFFFLFSNVPRVIRSAFVFSDALPSLPRD